MSTMKIPEEEILKYAYEGVSMIKPGQFVNNYQSKGRKSLKSRRFNLNNVQSCVIIFKLTCMDSKLVGYASSKIWYSCIIA